VSSARALAALVIQTQVEKTRMEMPRLA